MIGVIVIKLDFIEHLLREIIVKNLDCSVEHIKEFNKSWNYFADMNDKEIENFVKSDLTWHKPTKSFGSPENFLEYYG